MRTFIYICFLAPIILGAKTVVKFNDINFKQFGTNYSGFYYPSDLRHLNSNSVIYCFGAGEDISHDIEIAHQLQSKVYVFDPTPRAIKHIQLIQDVFNGIKRPVLNSQFGGGDAKYWNRLLSNKISAEKIVFLPYGLYIKNAELKFYKPTQGKHVSHSLVPGMKSKKCIKVPVKTLKTIMKELKHDKIDFLKIDIEGVECDVIDYMLDENILPIYLSVDFDLGWNGEKIKDLKRCYQTINKLEDAGYVVTHSHRSDYSFIRRDYLF